MATDPSANYELIFQIVRDLAKLRDDLYAQVQSGLDDLVALSTELPQKWVNTQIGDAADVAWSGEQNVGGVTSPGPPEEPTFEGELPNDVTIRDVDIPAAVGVGAQPTFDALPTAPDDLADATLGPIAALANVPEVEAVIPTIEVSALEDEFEFTDPMTGYAGRVSTEVEAEIKRVLGGDLGLPQAHWDALWNKAAGDVARVQVGRAREAENTGIGAQWGLPSETHLTWLRRANDESKRELQRTRLETAIQQAVMAREDFWSAVDKALQYEDQWIQVNQEIARRALAAAEQLHRLRVDVYNANVQALYQGSQAATFQAEVDRIKIQRELDIFAAGLARNAEELNRDKQVIERYQAKFQGYGVSTTARIEDLAQRWRAWSAQGETHSRYQGIKMDHAARVIENYRAQVQKSTVASDAVAALLNARTGASRMDLAGRVAEFDATAKRNAVGIDVAKINQAAQEAQAQLDVNQGQYTTTRQNELETKAIDTLASTLNATVAASDVAAGASFSNNVNTNIELI